MMFCASLSLNSISILSSSTQRTHFKLITQATLKPLQSNSTPQKPIVVQNSLRVLEWDKVCDCIASFAGTPLGQQETKEKLWRLDQSYEESKSLLAETTAAVEMLKHGDCGLEFSGIDVVSVRSAVQNASRGLPVEAKEANAVASLLQFSEALQLNIKAACKEGSDWFNRFRPLSEMIMELCLNQPLVKSIQQVIDGDGSVKDSASLDLKRSREQVQRLERKLFQLMDTLVRKELDTPSSVEVSIDGRWCIKSDLDQLTTANGLLLSSGSGGGSLVEPLSAVPLNDELQRARASVARAEEAVLLRLTEKMRAHLDDICNLLNTIVQLDVVTARAKYSISYGGTFPELLLKEGNNGNFGVEKDSSGNKTLTNGPLNTTKREWILYLPKAYHPLLLQQHQQNLRKAKKNLSNANADIRRRKLQPENTTLREAPPDTNIKFLEMEVAKWEEAHPIPVDFFISAQTRVLIITGPNTGGKTIGLKTVGLASLMAKSGVYVLSSEPVRIPWFDSIFADIGDEQSLSQSLSTFSGHLKQISAIQAQSTSQSLVLLDEVGAGTNPLEGAALGMSLLESFAEAGAFLTIATTHHGELKTLKYSNKAFENACMEFDEINLKPTYKILWGVPGRSNAINIAERLGLPETILDNARESYGTASAEINEVIIEMERFKQDHQKHVQEAHQYLIRSRELYENLLAAKERITEHRISQGYKMMREMSEVAAIARSTLHKKLRQLRALSSHSTPDTLTGNSNKEVVDSKQHSATVHEVQQLVSENNELSTKYSKKSPPGKQITAPNVGDMVFVTSLGKKAKVLKVDASKDEIVVQASNMKMKMKLRDVQ